MKNRETETWKKIYDFIEKRSKVDDKDYIRIKRELYEYYDDIREEMMRDNIPFIIPGIIFHSLVSYINKIDEEVGCDVSVINIDDARKETERLRDWEHSLVMHASNNRDMFRGTIDTWWNNVINSDRITSKAKEYLRNVLIEMRSRYPYKK